MKGLLQGLYTLCEWVMRLTILNILWVVFSLMGAILLGFFPATAAMFEITRKWLKGETDIPIFKYFWAAYKKYFVKANLLGTVVAITGIFLYIDFSFFSSLEGFAFKVLTALVMLVSIIYFVLLIYIFPVFVTYEINLFQTIKFACLLGVYRPLSTIGILLGSILLYFLFSTFTPVLVFFGGSLTSIMMMWVSRSTFFKIKNKYSTEETV
ncbi:YesL family protein [Paenibacillus sp. BSR1-1]|uniref:YesL family protein n=1 Tax=Paenibacillus sp. BSR1-1 TaxID=3020845 RepID=UPI0025B1C9BC|nr:YesL family protein [Paenibacillus sp. BSR1-1]MDN3019093.1 YesL family protein [Paenibacillus sp. BSR1-1]